MIDSQPQAEPLGPALPGEFEWPKRTRDWWESWRRCEMARTFTQVDWEFLLDTAVFHALAWDGSVSAGAELRLRVSKMGATPEDRLRLRMEPDRAPASPAVQDRKQLSAGRSARRSRLLKVVDGVEAS